MKMRELPFVGIAGLGLTLATLGSAAAFEADEKRITMIVGSGAGGSADLFYRLLADHLQEQIGQNIEVINRAGAGTQLGLQAVADATADGYTLGQAALPTGIMVYLDPAREANFDQESFIPVSMLTFDPGATAVRADSPYQTMDDLIQAAEENPNSIRFGTGNRNTRQYLDAMRLEQLTGVDFRDVHAGSESSPVTMLLGGHMDVVHESVGDFQSLVESGQVRILGVWSEERSPIAPDVPTMEEQGYELYSGTSRGIILPAGTPEDAVQFWEQAIESVANSEEFQEGMARLNQPLRHLGREEYTQHWQELEAEIKPLMAEILQ